MIQLNELLKCVGEDVTVLAGQNGLSRPVSTVTVLDAPDSYEWLRGNELVLSTGYIFEENADILKTFTSNLIKVGASGVCLKMGRYVHELPLEVKALADDAGFPIIKLPYRIVWSDVMSEFYQLKYNLQQSAAIKVEPEMIAAAVEASKWSTASLLKQLTKFFELPMARVKGNNEPIEFNNVNGTEYILNFLTGKPKLNDLLSSDNELIRMKDRYFCVHHIPRSHKLYTEYIVICSQSEEDLHEINKLFFALKNISGTAGALTDEKPKMYSSFISKVISGKIASDEVLKFDNNRNLTGFVYNGFLIISAGNYAEIYMQIEKIAKHFKSKDSYVQTHMFYNSIADEAIVLVEFQQARESENANCFLRRLFAELDEKLFAKGSFIAAGSMYESLQDAAKSYSEAIQAKHIGCFLWKHQHIYFHNTISPYVLMQISSLGALDFSDIIQLEKNKHSLTFDGLETIEMFLEIGNYKKTAQLLYIHENTLRHRIQKISELLCLNFNNPVVIHNFLLKIKLWRLKTLGKPV